MPYDPGLAERLTETLGDRPGLREQKMFGGIGYMLNGNMCVGIYKEFLIIRVGTERAENILARIMQEP